MNSTDRLLGSNMDVHADYEHLPPIPSRYGYAAVLASFVGFGLLHILLGILGPPAAVAVEDRWKWKNLLVSWTHSTLIGTWVVSSFFLYEELAFDLIAFHNMYTFCAVAFSTGYFVMDFVDIVIGSETGIMNEVLIHHVAVLLIFLYNITECRYIGYTLVALLVEVNSVFLHLRKLMQMLGVPFQHPVYQFNVFLNLGTFIGARYMALVWITYGIFAYRQRMSTAYIIILSTVMFVMWIINTVLFARLVKNDVLRSKKSHKSSNKSIPSLDVNSDVVMNNNIPLPPKTS